MDPRLPPGLWYPLPVSQSVHTDLLNVHTAVRTAGRRVLPREDRAAKDTRRLDAVRSGTHKTGQLC